MSQEGAASVLASTLDVFRQLVRAIPAAWREDRAFRWSAIGTVVTLSLGLLRVGDHRPTLPAASDSPALPAPAISSPQVPEPPRQASPAPPASLVPASPAIPPGRLLGAIPADPAGSGLDRFGTLNPRRQP